MNTTRFSPTGVWGLTAAPNKRQASRTCRLLLILCLCALGGADRTSAAGPNGAEGDEPDNIGHRRHFHRHNQPHPTEKANARFTTNRTGAPLVLPTEEDAFVFAVFGDRTGGPATGVSILADAVRDVNLLEPDLVMTVGDLIQGYNQTDGWMKEMHEYKGIMSQLLCPWFPVAGNHDVYYRGPEELKPEGEHEASYEMHFGPLWYAFEHKNSWFIVLYSDEGDPESGRKTFREPACQKMSAEQFAWLESTLGKASEADHVFLFLHHPRWLQNNYGTDWERVHQLLKRNGNVTAVFAGHIHTMRHDGPRDGIEYVTLATTGGHQWGTVPSVGHLHHFHLVTVRKNQVAMAAVPVGEVMDVREIKQDLIEQALELASLRPGISATLTVEDKHSPDGSGLDDEVEIEVRNPGPRSIDVTLTPHSDDSRWGFAPDHSHRIVEAGESWTLPVRVIRAPSPIDDAFRRPEVNIAVDILATGARYPVPERSIKLPVRVEMKPPANTRNNQALALDGEDDHIAIPSNRIELPDGPFTLECWMNAESFGNRTGLLAKTEASEYGFFVNNATPSFSVYLGDAYVTVNGPEGSLATDRWYHLAGVYDGSEVRLYVDGELAGKADGTGERRTNGFPLIVGGDVDGRGNATSCFHGRIDGVRLSRKARYVSSRIEPPVSPAADDDTVILLNMDHHAGPFLYDGGRNHAHPIRHGGSLVPR